MPGNPILMMQALNGGVPMAPAAPQYLTQQQMATLTPTDYGGGSMGAVLRMQYPGSQIYKTSDGQVGMVGQDGRILNPFTTPTDAPMFDPAIGAGLSIASMFIPGLQPLAAGLNVAQGAATGNVGQAIGGALGLPGVTPAVTGAIGTGLSDIGVPTAAIPYATKGIIGAGTTLASGGGLQNALTNGLAAGAGSFAGHEIASSLGASLPSSVTQGLAQAGAGALGSAIKGKNIGQGAFASGLNGFVSGLGSDFGVPNGVTSGATSLLRSVGQNNQQSAQNNQMMQLRQRIASLRANQQNNGNGASSGIPMTGSAMAGNPISQIGQQTNSIDPAKLAQLKQRIAAMRA